MRIAQSETQLRGEKIGFLERLSGFLTERISKRAASGDRRTLAAKLSSLDVEERDAVTWALEEIRAAEELREEVRRLKALARCSQACDRLKRSA